MLFKMRHYLILSLLVILSGSLIVSAQSSVDWTLTTSAEKVTSETNVDSDKEPLHLHAARQEYAPFQVIIDADEDDRFELPIVDYPADLFEVTIYHQEFIEIVDIQDPEIFTFARYENVDFIADGLRPVDGEFTATGNHPMAFWVDVYVRPDTPAGEYTLTVALPSQGAQTVIITVYDVDLEATAAMNIIIPVAPDLTIAHFTDSTNVEAYHREVNQLLRDNHIQSGTLVGRPVQNDSGWDFSVFTNELNALPQGTEFYAPLPYDVENGVYFITDENGNQYTSTNFDDATFVQALQDFFDDLANYLDSLGRLDDVWVYPTDETRWVADEPDHNGPEGFVHLSNWTQIIRNAGLRVIASRVSPALYATDWLPSEEVTDNTQVHMDVFDSAPQLFADWIAQDGRNASVYLNEYGDLIDLRASIQRGMIWHVYARDVRTIAGYLAMEWVDEVYNLVDPLTEPDRLSAEDGYGGGALVWPGPFSSVRLATLREGIEDARLLDLYANAQGEEAAKNLAACLTPDRLSLQNPPADLWNDAHTALLQALATGSAVDTDELCLPVPSYDDTVSIFNADRNRPNTWEAESAELSRVDFMGSRGMQVDFLRGYVLDDYSSLFYDIDGEDWSDYDVMLLEVMNPGDSFIDMDVAIGDEDGEWMILTDLPVSIPPGEFITITLPLVVPYGTGETFNFSEINYIEMAWASIEERRNGFGDMIEFDIGARTFILDNILIGR